MSKLCNAVTTMTSGSHGSCYQACMCRSAYAYLRAIANVQHTGIAAQAQHRSVCISAQPVEQRISWYQHCLIRSRAYW
jgi:hypothetical protein